MRQFVRSSLEMRVTPEILGLKAETLYNKQQESLEGLTGNV